ncbi:hypothetical protein ABW21_db0200706 [Orbilia brochopaga]|nr:hypothetical protein ABW21_db0200706 [Drechslerella brochopaga]
MRGGYFLKEDIRNFENEFFGINNVEATYMDPQQRKLLEVAFECFESAGVTLDALAGSNTGCYVGSFTTDFQTMQFRDPENLHQYSMSGMGATILSNRISHTFDLKGPSVTQDSACSASMYCLDTACNALSMGDCDGAIVAGANLIQSFEQQIALTKIGALSKTSTCHTFDSSADGYGRADAVGAIYLKRLSDAIRDGDPIRSVIRGTAVNSNGRTQGISLPSAEYQERVIRNAYAKAGLDTDGTTYMECHGTGTPVGDPIEVEAVCRAFNCKERKELLHIGSVKTNIGHGEASSAISGLMKVTLALENKFIPPSVGVTKINPKIKTAEWGMHIVTKGQHWLGVADKSTNKPALLRAGVSSFGYGGANGHAVLENAEYHLPPNHASASKEISNMRTRYILPFSGSTTEALNARIDDLGTSYNLEAVSIEDLAYTLGCRRTHLEKRGCIVLSNELSSKDFRSERIQTSSIRKSDTSPTSPYTFIFTGQGAQWPQMCLELFQEFTVFRDAIAEMDAILDRLPSPPDWKLQTTLLEPKATSNVMNPIYSQACCTAIQVALTLLLDSWDIAPSAVIGHSSGEIAASFAAGYLSLAEAITNAYYRGFVITKESLQASGKFDSVQTNGGMIAAGISDEDAKSMIKSLNLVGKIRVACINSPSSVTISGDGPAIDVILKELQEKKLFARKLETRGMAYHSHHMRPYAEDYYNYLESVKHSPFMRNSTKVDPKPLWISSVTGDVVDRGLYNNSYWRENVEDVVNFSKAVSRLSELVPQSTIIELGPHSTLELPLKQIRGSIGIKEENMPYAAAIIRHKNAIESVLAMAGQLFTYGHSISFDKVNGLINTIGKSKSKTCSYRVITDLPNYRWTYSDSPLWNEPRGSSEQRFRKYPRHELLGSLIPGGNGVDYRWRNVINLEDSPWLRDHKLGTSIVCPAACYLAMAIEALCQTVEPGKESSSVAYLENVNVLSPLVIPDAQNSNLELFTTLRPKPISFAMNSNEWWDFLIVSFHNGVSTTHATGTARIEQRVDNIPLTPKLDVPEEMLEPSIPRIWYEKLKSGGLDCGPYFQPVDDFSLSRLRKLKTCRATITVKKEFEEKNNRYFVHPVIIDVMIQSSVIATSSGNIEDLGVKIPTRIGSVMFVLDYKNYNKTEEQAKGWSINANAATTGFGSARCETELTGSENLVKVRFENLRVTSFEGNQIDTSSMDDQRHPMLRVDWKPDSSPGLLTNEGLSTYLKTVAEDIQGYNNKFQNFSACLNILGHKNPYLRVLELGDTRDRIRDIVLESLAANSQFPKLVSYFSGKYDDWSGSQLSASELDLKTGEFEDPEILPSDQQFDLIILGNKYLLNYRNGNIHKDLKARLATGGTILAISPSQETRGFCDGREFTAISSTGIQNSVLFIHHSQEYTASEDLRDRPIVVLEYFATPFGNKIMAEVSRVIGREPQRITFDTISQETIPKGAVIISLLEAQDHRSALISTSDPEFNRIKVLVEQASCLFWITNGDLLRGRSPNHGLAFGLSRAIMMEQPSLKFIVYDIDDMTANTQLSAQNILYILKRVSSVVDTEYIEKKGVVHISRFVPDDKLNEAFRLAQGAMTVKTPLSSIWQSQQAISSEAQGTCAQLSIKTPGQFDGLFFKEIPTPVLKSDQVQVSVWAVGLNAKDFYALGGRMDTKEAACVLEFCGVVEKVGSLSTGNLAVGDRVYVMAPTYFRTSEIVPHWACHKLRDDEDFGRMSVVPFAYATALYAICDKASLQKGESILIHSGTGGIGLAAIQLAQQIGAGEIYTTVSTPEKNEFLIRNLGIKPENIFNSRDLSFADQLMDATNGEGVDVVLNSLTGDLLHASWKCCGTFGRFVDISKKDLMEGGHLGMEQFLRNSTYTAFDLTNLYYSSNPVHNQTWSTLIAKAFEIHHTAKFIDVPLEIFDVENLPDALRKFGSRNRIGKISVSLENPNSTLNIIPSKHRLKLDGDKTYLMVGCLGGLGRSISRYLFDRGARKFVFLGRSGIDKAPARRIVQELTTLGGICKVIRGDASQMIDVQRAVEAADSCGPIGGIVQAAMGMNHAIFSNMSNEDWRSGIDPKTRGTWNLHHAIQGKDTQLDFFLLTSSVTGSIGAAAESNYTAANCFLDFFARYRQSRGLPATAIGLGMISEVGFLHENPEIENLLLRRGIQQLDESEMLAIIDISLFCSSSSSSAGLYDPGATSHILTGLEPLSIKRGSNAASSTFQDPRASILARAIHEKDESTGMHQSNGDLPAEIRKATESGTPIDQAFADCIANRFGDLILIPADFQSRRAVSGSAEQIYDYQEFE